MFTVAQIKAAHAKVKSGADFPRYIADLKNLGVRSYRTSVADGHTVYNGDGAYTTSSPTLYAPKTIASNVQREQFTVRLAAHQRGESDYLQFCTECAEFGIDCWEVNLPLMTCTYLTTAGELVLVEVVPGETVASPR